MEKIIELESNRKSNEAREIYTSSDQLHNEDRDSESTLPPDLSDKPIGERLRYWVKGSEIDFRLFYENKEMMLVDLPRYAFDHGVTEKQIRVDEAVEIIGTSHPIDASDTIIGNDIEYETYTYDEPYLRDHTVNQERVVLGVTYASLAINTFFKLHPMIDQVHLRRLQFLQPVVVKEGRRVDLCIENHSPNSPEIDFKVGYRYDRNDLWSVAATGRMRAPSPDRISSVGRKINLETTKTLLKELRDLDQIYHSNRIVELGESFKTITNMYTDGNQVLARVNLGKPFECETHHYDLHPLITNSAFLAVSPLLNKSNMPPDGYLPFGINDIYFQKIGALQKCWLLIRLINTSDEIVIFDADLFTDEYEVVGSYKGCSLKRFRSQRRVNGRSSENFNTSEPSRVTISDHTDTVCADSQLQNKIRQYLIDELNAVTKVKHGLSDIDANLMDLGVASEKLVELTNMLEKTFNLELDATLLFEFPNIRELSEYFAREYEDVFSSYFEIAGDYSGNHVTGKQSKDEDISPPTRKLEPPVLETDRKITDGSLPLDALKADQNDIAVIGMNGRFAEADDMEQFWRNLCAKKDLIKEVPIDHWDYRPWFDEDINAKDRTYCKWGSFIADVDKFDAEFFKISPREAEWMDPQMRLMLQCIYSTIEDAGYANQMRGSDTGVFVGVCFHDYADKIAELNLPVNPYLGTGNAQTAVANRASFLFDFNGPSVAVDTACSSSLFALHHACQALKNSECKMAFAGGVNLLLSSSHYRYFSSIGALSPTGRCHTFDNAADGYVPGECVAGVLLKPLRSALNDGDRIYAVIKGAAALHGGYTPSLTAPSVAGEENVIIKAWEDAGIDPETISYIEAHGTGTKLGDPIEIR
ncbi:MAG: hypothetical protein GY850_10005, partial [bacterium]|nr:hypothetical protein [bacterium]